VSAVPSATGFIELPLLEAALLVGSPRFGEVLLVRHAQQGENGLNDPARPKGGDAPLSELGVRQARAVGVALADGPIAAVYSSHLSRAHATAAAIAQHHGLEPVVDQRLEEVGIFRDVPAGRTVDDEIGLEGMAEVRREFVAHRRWDAFPLSEAGSAIRERVGAAFDEILARHDEAERVAIVCHGGIINAVVRDILGVDADMFFYPAHASVTRLGRGDGRLAVRSLNEDWYLRSCPDTEVTY
jgi:2,3-bisphosphoglycerate-dependent phosphoglycerate mutase